MGDKVKTCQDDLDHLDDKRVEPIIVYTSPHEGELFAAIACFIVAGFGLGLFIGYSIWGGK